MTIRIRRGFDQVEAAQGVYDPGHETVQGHEGHGLPLKDNLPLIPAFRGAR